MRTWSFRRAALGICATTILAGCGVLRQAQDDMPSVGAGAIPQTRALAARIESTNYKVVHSFRGGTDGAKPVASLIDVGGTLYGTTADGGTYSCAYSSYQTGCGTVFSLTKGGKEKVLYSFRGSQHSDGWKPEAGLVDVNGTLYGTTADGDIGYALYYGTVYSVSTSGTEKVVYAFKGGYRYGDGSHPDANLIDVNGTLYGTTIAGGAPYPYGRGTVFSVTTSGQETVLHSFAGASDGGNPEAGLVDVKGVLFGTTWDSGTDINGTVFSITPSGVEKVLYKFRPGVHDGIEPSSGLIYVKRMLYGTTYAGGSGDCGTVFRISTTGAEKVLYSFECGSDGEGPVAGLTELHGVLYGTTQGGGTYKKGTVFSVSTSGTEKVLHTFGGGTDGDYPEASLIDVNGTLYGTTEFGGTHGKGTVFALTP